MTKKKLKNPKKIIDENPLCQNSKHSKFFKVTIFVLLILNFILSLSILVEINSKNSIINSIDNSKLARMESKINSIDNFFASNVKGYGDSNSNKQVAQNPTNKETKNTVNVNINIDGEPTIGNENAKVTVVEFSDYECPFCGKWHSESYEQLKKEYIDSGKVKFVFKDFPLGFHKKAMPRAISSNCVLKELGNEKYFEFHNIMFNNQQTFTDSDYKSEALKLGVDTLAYDSCIKDPAIKIEIENDIKEGTKLGVSGTPSFFINGNLIVGAQPYSVIKTEIEKALK